MNDRRSSWRPAAFAAFLVATSGAAVSDGVSVLNDASFEQESPGETIDWSLFEIGMVSKNHARSGEHSMYNGGYSRSVAHPPYFIGNASGAFQEFPAEPGSRWRLTGYGLTPAMLEGSPAFGILQVSFFDANGENLGTVETADSDTRAKLSNEVNRKSAVGEWIYLDTGVATAPDGTATIQAFTLYVDYSGKNRSQGVYFDDLALCDVSDGSEGCGEQ